MDRTFGKGWLESQNNPSNRKLQHLLLPAGHPSTGKRSCSGELTKAGTAEEAITIARQERVLQQNTAVLQASTTIKHTFSTQRLVLWSQPLCFLSFAFAQQVLTPRQGIEPNHKFLTETINQRLNKWGKQRNTPHQPHHRTLFALFLALKDRKGVNEESVVAEGFIHFHMLYLHRKIIPIILLGVNSDSMDWQLCFHHSYLSRTAFWFLTSA